MFSTICQVATYSIFLVIENFKIMGGARIHFYWDGQMYKLHLVALMLCLQVINPQGKYSVLPASGTYVLN